MPSVEPTRAAEAAADPRVGRARRSPAAGDEVGRGLDCSTVEQRTRGAPSRDDGCGAVGGAAAVAAAKPRREETRDAATEASRSRRIRRAGGGRGGRGSRTEDGRRYSTAGHALIVALLGLLFGALLLAPGMHKAAFNGQPGTKRDVSLALTGGLAHVSHALLLDRPRGLVQDAMGRGDADEIDVAIVVPPTT